jgi:hypothetical protein
MSGRFAHVIFALAAALALLAQAPATALAQGRSWTIAPTPLRRIGAGTADAEQFSAVVGATRLPNGHLLIGDRGDHSLMVFDAKGALVTKFGRKGTGPGEIGYMLYLFRCGDSIATVDIAPTRVSVFSLDGKFVRSFRFSGAPYRSACGPAGRWMHYGWESEKDMKAGPNRALAPYWLTPMDSTAGIMLGRFPGSERVGNVKLPLGREPRVAVGRDRAYLALADSFHIRAFGLDGSARPGLRATSRPVPSTPADVNAEKERDIGVMGETSRKMLDELYASTPHAKTLPATRELVVDADDNLWVQHFPRGGATSVRWTVFSPQGVLLATIELPAAMELFEVGRDYVLGRYVDADEGIPEVRMYRLRR